jgi:hypothetical protein
MHDHEEHLLLVNDRKYGFMRLDQNWTAYSTVQGMADEYNNKLLQEISNK